MKRILSGATPRDLIFILFGVLLFAVTTPLVSGTFNAGSVGGMAVGILLFTVGAKKITFVRAFRCSGIKNKAARAALRFLAAALFLGFIWAAFCAFYVVFRASYPSVDSYGGRTVIVLGCHVKGDIPGPSLEKRIRKAYETLSADPSLTTILTGGRGEGEDITEAEAMRRALTELGIEEKRLIIEDRSVNTEENIKFAAELIEKNGLPKDVLIITQSFHQSRAAAYCFRYGLSPAPVNARSEILSYPTYFIRELFGVTYYLFY